LEGRLYKKKAKFIVRKSLPKEYTNGGEGIQVQQRENSINEKGVSAVKKGGGIQTNSRGRKGSYAPWSSNLRCHWAASVANGDPVYNEETKHGKV